MNSLASLLSCFIFSIGLLHLAWRDPKLSKAFESPRRSRKNSDWPDGGRSKFGWPRACKKSFITSQFKGPKAFCWIVNFGTLLRPHLDSLECMEWILEDGWGRFASRSLLATRRMDSNLWLGSRWEFCLSQNVSCLLIKLNKSKDIKWYHFRKSKLPGTYDGTHFAVPPSAICHSKNCKN